MFRNAIVLVGLGLYAYLGFTSSTEDSFSDLVKSEVVYQTEEEVVKAEQELFAKYQTAATNDANRKSQHDRRELEYGDKIMKFSLEKRGEKPQHGYPVYIALHGGGGAPAYVNDSQWEHMKVYYRDSVENGIYIAPRGVTNTWNLHFVDESYPLYDRLIENLITYEGADPNRIYLLGFSAGGDGVYQIVPRMPDRFAAANMSAGHHNWVRFDNLLNTPFLLQVGELDSAYNRNRVAAENSLALDGLQQLHQGYVHDLFIHHQKGHNGWYDNDAQNRLHPVIKNPRAWLDVNDRSQVEKNTNAVTWLNQHARTRLPEKIIWDLSTRADRKTTWGANYVDNSNLLSENKNLFYWLALDENALTSGRIEATINSDENAVYLNHVEGLSSLRILLHRELFDFSRSVVVYYQGRKIAEKEPSTKLSVMAKTLLMRGDPSLVFHDELVVNLPAPFTAAESDEEFSYCSDGKCSLMSAERFNNVRGFPLNLNYTCKNSSHYALTFDDGPSENYPALLDTLARHDVKATFFVVGKNLETQRGRELVLNAHTQGHEISNHSYTHRSLTNLTKDEIVEELSLTKERILEIVGDNEKTQAASSIVRPPFGDIDQRVQDIASEMSFRSVRWNSDRYDWKMGPHDGALIKKRVEDHLSFIKKHANKNINRSILDLNHDGSVVTLSVLDEVIPMIKEHGYQFVTLSECLKE